MTADLVTFHAVLRWLVLASAAVALVVLLLARSRGGWSPPATFWCQAYAYAIGVQSVLGMLIWLLERRWTGGSTFFTWIHPMAMLAAVAIAHGGLAHAYRQGVAARTNRIATASVAGSFAVVLLAVPWLAH
jgi:hypothetical protein